LIRLIVFHDQRSRLETDNLLQVGICHSQIGAIDRSIGREYHLVMRVPHILSGASSSSNIGWLINISLEVVTIFLISSSLRLTCFPGFWLC
jgi:hypothetical protein